MGKPRKREIVIVDEPPKSVITDSLPMTRLVEVIVLVSHEMLREGDVVEVPLTGRNQALIDVGYLEIVQPNLGVDMVRQE